MDRCTDVPTYQVIGSLRLLRGGMKDPLSDDGEDKFVDESGVDVFFVEGFFEALFS